MAEPSELRMNVAALKRVDPYVKEILGTATHVALYTFNAEANEWERTDVEGALFVYSRNGEPYHGILIMNRLNTNNLVEPVVQGLELQLQEPFLLYRNTKCRIFGIWFYDKDQCTRIASMLDRLVKDLDTQKKVPSSSTFRNKSVGSGTSGVDIFSMLNKAQEDFNSNKVPEKKCPGEVKKQVSDDVPPKSVMDFFAKATGNVSHFSVRNAHPPGINVSHPQRTGDNNLKPLLQRLMSNPAHSVEHIEKQQRSATPHADKSNSETTQTKKEIKILNGNSLKGQPTLNSVGERTGVIIPIDVPHPKAYSHPPVTTTCVDNSMNFLRISSPNKGGSSLAQFFASAAPQASSNGVAAEPVSDQRSSSAPAYNAETPSKVALMPPTMFTSVTKEANNLEAGTAASDKNDVSASSFLPNTSHSNENRILIKPEPLTKNQLLQAFNYLLKHDTDFVNKLHEAYVKSFADIVHS